MTAFLLFWSHALAAVLYGALALWQVRRWNQDPLNRPLAAAFAVTSLWAILTATVGPYSMAAGLAESGRNFACLAFMYGLIGSAQQDERQRAVKLVYTVVAGVIGLQLTFAGVAPQFVDKPHVYEVLVATGQIFGLTIAAGALVLVHNLYGQASPESRWGIRLAMIALAGMWVYDLHLYTVGYLSRGPVDDLVAMRGAILSALVPLFALASRRSAQWRVRISRAATFQSLSVMAILGYLILMMSATRALEIVGGDWVRVGQVVVIFAMTLIAVVLLPSGRMRAWSRVILAKHFFEHRYDYREEWLRFTRTTGVAGEDEAGLGERIVKAVADIADSPGGLLLVPEEGGRLTVAARWNWDREAPECLPDPAFVRFIEAHAFVLDFEEARRGRVVAGGESVAAPAWTAALTHAWAGVPLLHNDRLAGLVVLAHPLVRRPLDWEDFDLFRTAGIQAASYLAEARSQEALANAQRFDEFNRRFAFIMHDIKNLVSQISLVARNAERHADKPEFRQDMIATLESSVRKMNDLLARLSRGNPNVEAEPVRAIAAASAAARVAEVKRRVHPVDVAGDLGLAALADPARLEQALMHLVQNAIDASPDGAPVRIEIGRRGEEAAIDVIDRGAGMSADFVRTRLFQPFASTKASGFGVGAFEAKSLVAAMGGRLEVESREGFGTRFTLFLPLAPGAAADRRMCA
ncbi:MAG: PEP-CTERM system histidine kinase PrsK [Alphaproteobacteria bacterium]|nr:PEP-CTERM system histidine kinase PrsK [Alphaproteobacteria bacterium]MBV9372041.1 PEP-CTERM system histidine kinase PrsK [Alphaproteobacteria bacterium]MBV9902649.1 PEP-CTERM system histidine kinase PrsK [Alphaproteobacteria bacterium]